MMPVLEIAVVEVAIRSGSGSRSRSVVGVASRLRGQLTGPSEVVGEYRQTQQLLVAQHGVEQSLHAGRMA